MKLVTLSAKLKQHQINRDNLGPSPDAFELLALIDKIEAYDRFLDQPLTLGMFTPCKDGKPLEEPIEIGMGIAEGAYGLALDDYQEAKEAVIFEGWKINHRIGTEGIKYFITHEILGCVKVEKYSFGYVLFLNDKDLHSNKMYTEILNVSELAEYTKDNPITLKTKA